VHTYISFYSLREFRLSTCTHQFFAVLISRVSGSPIVSCLIGSLMPNLVSRLYMSHGWISDGITYGLACICFFLPFVDVLFSLVLANRNLNWVNASRIYILDYTVTDTIYLLGVHN
jgi:hypothetical protein